MVVCSSLEEVTHMSAADSLGHRFPAAAKARVPFFRVWCLFEIFYAAIEGKPIVMKGGSFRLEEGSEGGLPAIPFISDPDMLMSMYFAIDVEQADAKWLVENGADVNAVDQNGKTAIMAAAKGGQLTCLQWLADINAVDQNGKTAIMAAARGGQLTCLQWLAENGVDVNAVDQDGTTAIAEG
eukprot:gene29983-biopygen19175